MAIPININLTSEGRRFIREVCRRENQRLLRGRESYPLANTLPPTSPTKEWVCDIIDPRDNTKKITNGRELAEALIFWFDLYGQRYQIDANLMAAQAYVESNFRLWGYSPTAMGISQFTMETIYTVVVNNFGRELNQFDLEMREVLTAGLTNPLNRDSYTINSSNNDIPNRNKPILHQNICNNPGALLAAQFKYMRWIAERTNNLASSTLFCYNRGPAFAKDTYSATIQDCIQSKKSNPDYYKEGVEYVLKTFIVLGDRNNSILFNKRKTKPRGIYFEYGELFNYRNANNQEFNQLLFDDTVDNNFQVFDANIEESKLLGIDVESFEKNIVSQELSKLPNYTFIYFPEQNYNRVPRNLDKNQLVLHHTVSGDNVDSSVNHWLNHWKLKGEKIATAFIINRRGEIYQLFSTDYWAGHIGAGSKLNQRSIGIELASWGWLKFRDGAWYPDNKNAAPIPEQDQIIYSPPFFGFERFERYTQAQIDATRQVILAISKGHPNIDLTYRDDMFGIFNPSTNQYERTPDALAGITGIWSHTAYRLDKSDVHPQPELIQMLQGLRRDIA